MDAERIRVLPHSQVICSALGLDPLGLIASGCLLATLAPPDVPAALEALRAQGIDAWDVGEVVEPQQGLTMKTAEGVRELPKFDRDELARFFGS